MTRRRKNKPLNETVSNGDMSASGSRYHDSNNNNILIKAETISQNRDNTSNSVDSQTDRLESNYYSIRFDLTKCKSVFKYLVSTKRLYGKREIDKSKEQSDIGSNSLSVNESRLVFNQMIANYSVKGRPFYGVLTVFDGKSIMYASRMLISIENKRFEVTVTNNEKTRNYMISIEFNKILDFDLNNRLNSIEFNDELALFVDTAIKHEPSIRMIQIGKTFHKKYVSLRNDVKFDSNNNVKYLSANYMTPSSANKSFKSLSFGTYISVENIMSGIAVNADRKPHYIYKPLKLINFIALLLDEDIYKIPKLSDSKRDKIFAELNGLIVETSPSNKYAKNAKFKIIGLTEDSYNNIKGRDIDINARRIRFSTNTRADYYSKEYSRVLDFGHLPSIEALANNETRIYLPIEVCRLIPDQPITRNLTEQEIEELTYQSNRLKPTELFDKIRIGFNHITRLSHHIMDKFGIIIDNEFVETNAKFLSPPKLRYSNRVVTPFGGKWNLNDWHNKNYSQFTTKSELKHWIIVDMSKEFTDRNNHIQKFGEMLIKHANYLGMNVSKPQIVRFNGYVPKRQIIRNIIFPKSKETINGLQMVCFIFPDDSSETIQVINDDLYEEIKLIGDCYEGIITECINCLNIKKLDVYHIDNLLAKINAKLGGTNVALLELPQKLENKRVMIIGAHVLDRCNVSNLPSICAVVGSYDTNFSQYSTRISIQPKTSETIDDLANMIHDIIEVYRDNHSEKKAPEIVVLYRDFTSDDPIDRVSQIEMQLIANGFSKYETIPKLTYIALTKGHNTKFARRDCNGKDSCSSQNVCAGSVVESHVTHHQKTQFYLCSHNSTIGTTRLLEATVVCDYNQLSSGTIQQITNQLCYISPNYTKSMATPTPLYYSNLAAKRANIHLCANINNNSSAVNNEANILYPKLRNVLYFC